MASLIETFHIDWHLLLAQIINFGVAFCVLYFFALKPLAAAMRERSDKIAKGLSDGESVKKQLAKTEAEYKSEIARAKKEAAEILARAAEAAEAEKRQLFEKAKEEIEGLMTQERAKIAAEKSQMLKEIKSEAADLVIIAAEKFLVNGVDSSLDKKIINKLIK